MHGGVAMGTISQNIVSRLADIKYDSLSKEVIDKVKFLLLHHLSCACYGRKEEWTNIALDCVRQSNDAQNATIWFTEQKGSAFNAAFANGVMAQSNLQEDVHVASAAHPGIVIFPCVLPLGETLGRTGREIIEAIVAGYEAMINICKCGASTPFAERGFRPTSVFGVFGSSVASGVLLKLNFEQLVSAISYAGHMSCGINEWGKAGTNEMYIQNGFAAANGIICAQLVNNGLVGSPTIFEGADNASGLCNAFGLNKDALYSIEQEERMPYGIMSVLCKSSPSCAMTQTTAQLAKKAAANGVRAEDIDSIIVYTPTKAKNYSSCNMPGPYSCSLQARTSQKYVVANILYNGGQFAETFGDYKNDAVSGLSNRVVVEADSEFDKMFPRKLSGRLVIYLRNGNVKEYTQDDATYLTDKEIIDGFRNNLSVVFSEEKIQKIFTSIYHLEDLENITELTQLLAI